MFPTSLISTVVNPGVQAWKPEAALHTFLSHPHSQATQNLVSLTSHTSLVPICFCPSFQLSCLSFSPSQPPTYHLCNVWTLQWPPHWFLCFSGSSTPIPPLFSTLSSPSSSPAAGTTLLLTPNITTSVLGKQIVPPPTGPLHKLVSLLRDFFPPP